MRGRQERLSAEEEQKEGGKKKKKRDREEAEFSVSRSPLPRVAPIVTLPIEKRGRTLMLIAAGVSLLDSSAIQSFRFPTCVL